MIFAFPHSQKEYIIRKTHQKERHKVKEWSKNMKDSFAVHWVILWGIICDAKGRMLSVKTEWWKQLLGLRTRSILRVSIARYANIH